MQTGKLLTFIFVVGILSLSFWLSYNKMESSSVIKIEGIRDSAIDINTQIELIRLKLESKGKLSSGQLKFIDVGVIPNDMTGDPIVVGLKKIEFNLSLILNEL